MKSSLFLLVLSFTLQRGLASDAQPFAAQPFTLQPSHLLGLPYGGETSFDWWKPLSFEKGGSDLTPARKPKENKEPTSWAAGLFRRDTESPGK